jgi:hypothetical protein
MLVSLHKSDGFPVELLHLLFLLDNLDVHLFGRCVVGVLRTRSVCGRLEFSSVNAFFESLFVVIHDVFDFIVENLLFLLMLRN